MYILHIRKGLSPSGFHTRQSREDYATRCAGVTVYVFPGMYVHNLLLRVAYYVTMYTPGKVTYTTSHGENNLNEYYYINRCP